MTIDDLAVEAGLFLKEGELLFNFHEDSRTQLQGLRKSCARRRCCGALGWQRIGDLRR